MKISDPIIEKIKDNEESLQLLKKQISNSKDEKRKDIIMAYPTVYIHNWKNKDKYEAYVGESNNIYNRTKQHYRKMNYKKKWQNNLLNKNADLYIIGHEYFSKSMTMDIETKLIHYLTSVENVKRVYNEKTNRQNK